MIGLTVDHRRLARCKSRISSGVKPVKVRGDDREALPNLCIGRETKGRRVKLDLVLTRCKVGDGVTALVGASQNENVTAGATEPANWVASSPPI